MKPTTIFSLGLAATLATMLLNGAGYAVTTDIIWEGVQDLLR